MTQQELEKEIKEIWTLFKKTDEKIKEATKIVVALNGKRRRPVALHRELVNWSKLNLKN